MALTLFHNDMSVCAQKVRLCLAEKQLAYEDKHLNLRVGDQKRPEYLALNPNGYVPTLVHDDFVLGESTVICEYIDDAFTAPPLRPSDPRARARMRSFTKFIDAAIFRPRGQFRCQSLSIINSRPTCTTQWKRLDRAGSSISASSRKARRIRPSQPQSDGSIR
jgi:glutathione S-transferase